MSESSCWNKLEAQLQRRMFQPTTLCLSLLLVYCVQGSQEVVKPLLHTALDISEGVDTSTAILRDHII